MWKVSSPGGAQWVTYRDGTWSADDVTALDLPDMLGKPTPSVGVGRIYRPHSADDEVGTFLAAMWLVPNPATVTGTPPAIPVTADPENDRDPASAVAAAGFVPAAPGADTAQQLQQQWTTAKTSLLEQWPQTAQPMVDELADQAQDAADSGDVSALGALAVSAGVLAAVALVLNGKSKGLAGLAAAGVVAEAAAQDVVVTVPAQAAAERVRQTADAFARIIASGYASGAARAALQLAGADPASVREAVQEHLADLSGADAGFVADNISALLSSAQHAGRLAVLQQHPASAYAAVEINDQHRCRPCADISGHQYRTLAAALEDYPANGYRRCLGGQRCRGYVRPIWAQKGAAAGKGS